VAVSRVIGLGDADGDGRAEVAVPSERGDGVVLYGRSRWPARIDLAAARIAGSARLVGSDATGYPATVARSGRRLLVGTECRFGVGPCADGVAYRVALPSRDGSVILTGAATVTAPPVAAGQQLAGPADYWVSAPAPTIGWNARPTVGGPPTVTLQSGARTWRLEPASYLIGAAPGVAVTARGGDGPRNDAERYTAVLYRVQASGQLSRARVSLPRACRR